MIYRAEAFKEILYQPMCDAPRHLKRHDVLLSNIPVSHKSGPPFVYYTQCSIGIHIRYRLMHDAAQARLLT